MLTYFRDAQAGTQTKRNILVQHRSNGVGDIKSYTMTAQQYAYTTNVGLDTVKITVFQLSRKLHVYRVTLTRHSTPTMETVSV